MRSWTLRSRTFVTAIALACLCLGCPTNSRNESTMIPKGAADTGDATTGEEIFATARTTTAGADLACAGCHADDGSGNIGPDIRGSGADHLQEHSQGDGPHPEGVKFDQLTAENFADIAAYLGEQCAADPDCTPGENDDDDHSDEGETP